MSGEVSRIRDRLPKLVGRSKKVHLTRAYSGEPTHNGFVLGLGRELVLLHQFHDFYPEGYTALRVEDINQIRSGKHERFWETMLRGEGLMKRVGINYEVPLDDFRSLLADFQIHGRYIIIECEKMDAADDDYLIGRILILGDKTVSIMHFDSLGNWYDEPAVVAYEHITKVQFNYPYMILTKYLGQPPDCL